MLSLSTLTIDMIDAVARYGPLSLRPSRGVIDWLDIMAAEMPSMDVRIFLERQLVDYGPAIGRTFMAAFYSAGFVGLAHSFVCIKCTVQHHI